MRSPAVLVQTFRERGLRVTPQRERLFRIMQEERRHPTIEALYEAARREMPTISRKTVYQTVYTLAALGEVQILDLGTGSQRVELTVERSHHHLVCVGCGQVRDLFMDLPGLDLSSVHWEGFQMTLVEVIGRGLCPDCAKHRRRTGDRSGKVTSGPAGRPRQPTTTSDQADVPVDEGEDSPHRPTHVQIQPRSRVLSQQRESVREEDDRRV